MPVRRGLALHQPVDLPPSVELDLAFRGQQTRSAVANALVSRIFDNGAVLHVTLRALGQSKSVSRSSSGKKKHQRNDPNDLRGRQLAPCRCEACKPRSADCAFGDTHTKGGLPDVEEPT